jgi:DNA ligase (NAD+)
MDKLIIKVSTYSDEKLQTYFDNSPIKQLHELKLYTDDKYYNTGDASGFEDWQYDMLKETLTYRDPDYVPPVGSKLRTGENRVTLDYWLGSQNKLKPEDVNEMARWISLNRSEQYIIESKLDGVSCLLTVKNDKIKLYTRGDGVVGADISYLAPYFSSIPKKINKNITIRGELIMNESTFKKEYAKDYANPRNMVAGRLGGKTARKGLEDIEFVAYEIVDDKEMPSPSEQLQYLCKLGFTVVKYELIDTITIADLTELFLIFKQDSPYEIDGLIVQANISYERNTVGNPDYAFAFKIRLGSNMTEAYVEEVKWNISKWGVIKPRVRITPVSLNGVKITYATGFNAKYITNHNIGPGAVVNITRSGDVIPFIVEVLSEADEPQMPEFSYKWNETGVDIYTEEFGDVMCVKTASSFFDKLGIKYVSEKTVQKMYDNGLTSILEMVGATQEQLEDVEGFGSRSAERVYQNIQNGLRDVSIPLVLGASGVFGYGLGRKRIELLFEDIPDLLDIYSELTPVELKAKIMRVEGFSDKSADKIIENVEYADKFIQRLSNFATFKTKIVVSDNLKGQKFVFSGFRDKVMETSIVERGGKVTSSISKNTNGLILPIKSDKLTGKSEKASNLGVPIYSKHEFTKQFL